MSNNQDIITRFRNALGLPPISYQKEFDTWKTLPDGTSMRIRHSVDLTRFYAIKSKMGG